MNRRKLLWILIVWPFVAGALTLLTHAPFLLSMVFFYGIPAILLTAYNQSQAIKNIWFSLVFVVGLGIPFEYIVEYTRHYVFPVTLFSQRLLGVVPWDILIAYVISIYAITSFYAFFSDRTQTRHAFPGRMVSFVKILACILGMFFILYATAPNLLRIPYFYLIFGIIGFIVPLAIVLKKSPHLRPNIIAAGVYFALVASVVEATALHMGYWYFPATASSIGHIMIGPFFLSIEELIMFILLSAPAALAYYEYFDGNQ